MSYQEEMQKRRQSGKGYAAFRDRVGREQGVNYSAYRAPTKPQPGQGGYGMRQGTSFPAAGQNNLGRQKPSGHVTGHPQMNIGPMPGLEAMAATGLSAPVAPALNEGNMNMPAFGEERPLYEIEEEEDDNRSWLDRRRAEEEDIKRMDFQSVIGSGAGAVAGLPWDIFETEDEIGRSYSSIGRHPDATPSFDKRKY